MIRNGNFGSDFDIKLYMTIGALFICIFDVITRHRKDYFYIFGVGTVIWGTIELLIEWTGIRVFKQAYLFGTPLPIIIASLLRGTSEGSAIAVMGIAIGDRIQEKITNWKVWIIFFTMIGLVVFQSINQAQPYKDVGVDVFSRRDIFTPNAIIVLGIMISIGFIWLWKTDRMNRRRGYLMVLIMIIFSTAWTIAEFYSNTRWIEWDLGNGLERAPLGIEVMTLTYDIIVEIAFCYLLYLALPSWFGWIKTPPVSINHVERCSRN